MAERRENTTLSRAQRDALDVLARHPGDYITASKQSSRDDPVPLVNATAVRRLVKLGLAKSALIPYASVFTSGFEYRITDEGLTEALRV